MARLIRRNIWLQILVVAGVLGIACLTWLPLGKSSNRDGGWVAQPVAKGDLTVSVTEQGILESSENTEIKCKVRGKNTVTWVVESGTFVQEGDELVRLDTLALEESINERKKFALWSRSGSERSEANVARTEIAITEYQEGRFQTELMALQKDLKIAETNLTTAKSMFEHAKSMYERGYVSQNAVADREFQTRQAEMLVQQRKRDIATLEDYTKRLEIEKLKGEAAVANATHQGNVERAVADQNRLEQAEEELLYCTIKAPRSGMVIYPSAAAWETGPDIEEGAEVHRDQVLLLMPDLEKMQVKVGIHESVIERVKAGMPSRVRVPSGDIAASVKSVAAVTRPAGWWTGNVVKYDTIIELPKREGLKPGMSAAVEVIFAEHKDVLKVPVAAIIETSQSAYCWVDEGGQAQKRKVELGDSNDRYVIATAGIKEGDLVILNPISHVAEAQEIAIQVDAVANQAEAVADQEETAAQPE